MKFLIKDNEDHKVVVQHMNCLLLLLLSNHFYLKQSLEPIKYHLYIGYLHNRPEFKTLNYLNTKKK